MHGVEYSGVAAVSDIKVYWCNWCEEISGYLAKEENKVATN